MLSRRHFLGTAAGLIREAPRRPPNLVLILADDLGYGDLGCYGQTRIKTPRIDALARQGTRFTDCYAGGVVCAPSRSVLMTGLHAGHTPIRANAGTEPIRPGDFTLPALLKKAGYATGGFGKWGLGDARSSGAPTRHGFDEFFGYLHQVHAHSYYPEFLWDNDTRLDLPGNRNGGRHTYSADLIAGRSLAFVRKNASRPFLLYACPTLPHAKFEIPTLEPYEKEAWTEGQKTYAAMVTRLDSYAGRILDLLKQLGVERDTLVLFSSDNGAHSGTEKGFEFFRSNGNFRGEKGQLYEGGIRVPMIARWPGRIPASAVNSTPWAFCDMLPTIAELSAATPPKGLDGISVAALLTAGKAPAREFLYWESNAWDGKTRQLRPGALAQAVRIGPWKALRLKPGAPLELYNLVQDPGETQDVAAQNPGIAARAEKFISDSHAPPRPHDQGSMQFLTQ